MSAEPMAEAVSEQSTAATQQPWSLLVIMTFTIVANLKHMKAQIHVPD